MYHFPPSAEVFRPLPVRYPDSLTNALRISVESTGGTGRALPQLFYENTKQQQWNVQFIGDVGRVGGEMTRRCRVLLVDDEAKVRRATARLLEADFDVAEAGSLEAARVSLALAVPDVLITDLDLGHGDRGEQLLAEARDLYPEVDRIVLSGSNVERVDELGDLAALVFRKAAFDPLTLVDAVRELWRGRNR